MNYPKQIFIQEEKDGDVKYLLAWNSADEANDGKVAIYKLDKVLTKTTKTVLT